jgi:hypothetical protein
MENIQEKFKRYAELKIQEKAISDELEEIKPLIKEHMLSEGVDKIPTTMGNFILSERTTCWQYSKAVETLQKAEKANRTAKAVKVVTLIFKAAGENDEDKSI